MRHFIYSTPPRLEKSLYFLPVLFRKPAPQRVKSNPPGGPPGAHSGPDRAKSKGKPSKSALFGAQNRLFRGSGFLFSCSKSQNGGLQNSIFRPKPGLPRRSGEAQSASGRRSRTGFYCFYTGSTPPLKSQNRASAHTKTNNKPPGSAKIGKIGQNRDFRAAPPPPGACWAILQGPPAAKIPKSSVRARQNPASGRGGPREILPNPAKIAKIRPKSPKIAKIRPKTRPQGPPRARAYFPRGIPLGRNPKSPYFDLTQSQHPPCFL